MDFEAAAMNLIKAVDGVMSNENIEGVIYVMQAIISANNENWEQWITDETNESLAIDNFSCDCGAAISVERTPTAVYVSIV
jgi:cytoplasmic iron level regulating protein YaaA (DUF328/UPF0246 family)